MHKVRYMGQPVTNWYGLDLLTGQVVSLPDSLVHKAVEPLFIPAPANVKADQTAETPEQDVTERPEVEVIAKPKRGRPRKE